MFADRVLKTTKLFMSTDNWPYAGGVAMAGDRICAVGPWDEVEYWIGPDTEVLDLGDAFVCPGFHDSHMHFYSAAIDRSRFMAFCEGTCAQDCVDSLRTVENARPREKFMLGYGWYHPLWHDPVLPTKEILDEAYPDRPVVLTSGDMHTLWCNSCALEKFGLTRDSVAPEGGAYQRDAAGELTGIIQEAAADALLDVVEAEFSQEESLEAIRAFVADLNAQGITSVGDVAPGNAPDRIRLYEGLEHAGDLNVRMNVFPVLSDDLSAMLLLRDRFASHDFIRVPGLKQFFDGVSSTHTAWLAEDYANARYLGDCGVPTTKPEDMRRMVLAAAAEGLPVRIHTIGDRAIHEALDIFEEARRVYGPLPDGLRNGLEHLENFQPADIERVRSVGVCANVQPPHMTLDPDGIERDLGLERAKYMWPFATYERLGIPYSLGTDAPVVDINSRSVLYDAVTRRSAETGYPEGGWHPEECITAAQAVRAYTLGSAIACGRARELGTLEAGKYADIAVLAHDIVGTPDAPADPELIKSAEVLMTIVGGKVVYQQ